MDVQTVKQNKYTISHITTLYILFHFGVLNQKTNKTTAQSTNNRDAQQMGMQKGEGDHICSDDKRLVVFLTGMEKPPTFCHLSNGSRKFELGLQLYEGVHILTTVP